MRRRLRKRLRALRGPSRVAPVLALAGYLVAAPTPDAITLASLGLRAAVARRPRVEMRHGVRALRWTAITSHAFQVAA